MGGPENLYNLLGVDPDATEPTIRKRYYALARELHPDLNPDDPEAEARFKGVSQAFSVLSNSEKRALYDEFGELALESGFDAEAARRAGASFRRDRDESGGFEAFFSRDTGGMGDAYDLEELFDGLFGGRVGRRGMRGADLETSIDLEFIESALGGERTVQVHGENSGGGQTRPIKLRIPPGASNGDRLRVREGGMRGRNGGPPGDLWVRVRVRPHEVFERVGDDLQMDLPVSVREATLGAAVEIPTLEGRATVRVPRGVDSGKTLRLRGQGVRRRNGTRGDLLARVKICTPKRLDAETRETIAKLERFEDPGLRDDLFGGQR